MKIDWELLCNELGITYEDEEASIHELAHAYDCIGEGAFRYVGDQTRVSVMIMEKYGGTRREVANLAEVKVSAVTHRVMDILGILTPQFSSMILTSLQENLRGDWYEMHPGEETETMFWDKLEADDVKREAEIIAKFIEENYETSRLALDEDFQH